MADLSTATLHAALASLGAPAGAKCCVGFSGGADSTALLKCLQELREELGGFELRAIHVNHHLHPRAETWAEHCAGLARQLAVPLLLLDARIEAVRGESLEAAAREARYRLFAEALTPAEFLLTAHHAEDQLETLLLQLARGAGVAGLAGMSRRTPCGPGEHLRPLLDFNREALQRYLAKSGLTWIKDPSNEDHRFDRNFMRHEVLPILRQRWPSLPASAVRSADHLASAQSILDELARADHFAAAEGTRLSVPMLRRLAPERMRNLLRYWIRLRNAPLPSSAILGEVVSQMLALTADTTPEVRWSGHVARRYRDRLYLSTGLSDEPGEGAWWDWKTQPEILLPAGSGRLRAREVTHANAVLTAIPDKLRVGWRAGGETLRLATNRPHRELRSLMQERGIVPWMRGRIPLLFAADELVAVGDLWIAAEFRASAEESGILLEWLDHPELY